MEEYNDWCLKISRGVIDGVIIKFDDKIGTSQYGELHQTIMVSIGMGFVVFM